MPGAAPRGRVRIRQQKGRYKRIKRLIGLNPRLRHDSVGGAHELKQASGPPAEHGDVPGSTPAGPDGQRGVGAADRLPVDNGDDAFGGGTDLGFPDGDDRSEERRGGKEWVRTGRSRWAPDP